MRIANVIDPLVERINMATHKKGRRLGLALIYSTVSGCSADIPLTGCWEPSKLRDGVFFHGDVLINNNAESYIVSPRDCGGEGVVALIENESAKFRSPYSTVFGGRFYDAGVEGRVDFKTGERRLIITKIRYVKPLERPAWMSDSNYQEGLKHPEGPFYRID